MLLNKEQVLNFLPHREPFLFIDTVKEIQLPENFETKNGPCSKEELVGATSVCFFRVDERMSILQGHFPAHPIVPGVIQIEMMAQAASFLVIHCLSKPIEEVKIDVQLLGVKSAKFRKPILPPMDLEIHATLKKVRGHIQIYDCLIKSSEEILSETTIMASLIVKDQ